MAKEIQRGSLYVAITLAATLAAINLSSFEKPTNKRVPTSIKILYSKWKAKYGVVNATPSEYAFRLAIFAKNRELLDHYREINPEATYNLNVYADRTEFEMNHWPQTSLSSEILRRKEINNVKHNLENVIQEIKYKGKLPDEFEIDGPELVDYRDRILSVRDQGECGSCWAFVAASIVEFNLGGKVKVSA